MRPISREFRYFGTPPAPFAKKRVAPPAFGSKEGRKKGKEKRESKRAEKEERKKEKRNIGNEQS